MDDYDLLAWLFLFVVVLSWGGNVLKGRGKK